MEEDKTEHLAKRMDDLSTSMNRLSKTFEDFSNKQPPPGGVYNYDANYNTKNGMEMTPMTGGDGEVDEFAQDFSKDENEERGNWTGRLDFLLSCLGYAVGLGNVWRFPYLCYKNGGAVFFIPYVIMLAFVGIPIFFMELSLGQYTSSSPLTCWEMARFFKGIGVGMVIVSALVAIYYNMIIAWAIFYFFASFRSTLPWTTCQPEWSSDFCTDDITVYKDPSEGWQNCTDLGLWPKDDGVCYNTTVWQPDKFGEMKNYTVHGIWNKTLGLEQDPPKKAVLASEDYLNGYVLGSYYSRGIDNMGTPRWDLTLCLLLAWVIVTLTLIKGVKSSGKVVYFTALFPYVVLVILLIRGVTLEGHMKGIEFYILKPDLSKLSEAAVWKDAAVQIFFSLSASWGGLIALSSYNRFHNDCLRDALIVSVGNCLTSFFAGFVIFSFLGFLATELGQEVEDVAESGVTLAFVVYPDAVTRMPVSTLWALLFFLMLITLGLDSEFALVETVTTSIMDQFPSLRKKKSLVIICCAIVMFLLGLTMTCNGGVYMLQIMDHYSGGWNVLVIALCECICVAYVYGFCRFKEDIRLMIGEKGCVVFPWNICYWWWASMWYGFTPLGVLFILIFSWYDYSEVTLGNYVYPSWGPALGWLMTITVLLGIFVTPLVLVIMQVVRGDSIMDLFRPSRYWGPALPKHRKLMGRYLSPDQFEVDPWDEGKGVDVGDVEADFSASNPGFDSGTKF